ncbi:hypothetical protein IMY05_001G0085500 [Salix suchowensis]|nr:hypothetical protein IMY05_001G0085500 [Salix suchowensis]
MTIHEGVNEIKCIMTNIILNLYRDGFQEVGWDELFKAKLAESENVYHECARDVGLSTSIPNPSMRIPSSFTS